jgi:glycosyltransferase involved in cell wall biosynthesis
MNLQVRVRMNSQIHKMTKIPVTFFQRKPFDSGNFSLEFIFDDVRKRLTNAIDPSVKILVFRSQGLFPRLISAIDCIFHQKTVNHVTGDTSYSGILLRPRKTVQTILDCGFLDNKTGVKRFFLWLFWLYLPIKRARKITTISEFVKQDILKNVACAADKITVIPVAVSEIFKPSPKVFNKTQPQLLQIGTAPNKNIPRLIEAIKGLNCTLMIVGKLQNDTVLALKNAEITYSNAFNLSELEIYNKYIECDILTFTSTHEGFGMPIIEANCVERAVITSNVASMPEVAHNAACLVDPFSAASIREGLLKIMNDEAYRNALIENGRANRARFDAETIAQSYYKIYKSIAEK